MQILGHLISAINGHCATEAISPNLRKKMTIEFEDDDDEAIGALFQMIDVESDRVVIDVPGLPVFDLKDEVLDYVIDHPDSIKSFTQSEELHDFTLDLFVNALYIREKKRAIYRELGFSRF